MSTKEGFETIEDWNSWLMDGPLNNPEIPVADVWTSFVRGSEALTVQLDDGSEWGIVITKKRESAAWRRSMRGER